jgi:hypothetical protein
MRVAPTTRKWTMELQWKMIFNELYQRLRLCLHRSEV